MYHHGRVSKMYKRQNCPNHRLKVCIFPKSNVDILTPSCGVGRQDLWFLVSSAHLSYMKGAFGCGTGEWDLSIISLLSHLSRSSERTRWSCLWSSAGFFWPIPPPWWWFKIKSQISALSQEVCTLPLLALPHLQWALRHSRTFCEFSTLVSMGGTK